jgi:hypothetical protein
MIFAIVGRNVKEDDEEKKEYLYKLATSTKNLDWRMPRDEDDIPKEVITGRFMGYESDYSAGLLRGIMKGLVNNRLLDICYGENFIEVYDPTDDEDQRKAKKNLPILYIEF